MKLSQLVLGVCTLLSVSLVGATTPTTVRKCNADNCLRAMFPTNDPARSSSASSFCRTYTTTVNTATTGLPARFTSGCQSNPTRFSSACSCGAPPTAVPNPCDFSSQIVKNGGFECGLSPWVAEARDPGTSFALTEPGRSGAVGSYAFWVYQNRPPVAGTGREQASINQNVQLVPGKQYVLNYWAYFNNNDAGFIGVMIDHQAKSTLDARDGAGINVWKQGYPVTFTATQATTNIRFEFLMGTVAIDRIDDVSITPV